ARAGSERGEDVVDRDREGRARDLRRGVAGERRERELGEGAHLHDAGLVDDRRRVAAEVADAVGRHGGTAGEEPPVAGAVVDGTGGAVEEDRDGAGGRGGAESEGAEEENHRGTAERPV